MKQTLEGSLHQRALCWKRTWDSCDGVILTKIRRDRKTLRAVAGKARLPGHTFLCHAAGLGCNGRCDPPWCCERRAHEERSHRGREKARIDLTGPWRRCLTSGFVIKDGRLCSRARVDAREAIAAQDLTRGACRTFRGRKVRIADVEAERIPAPSALRDVRSTLHCPTNIGTKVVSFDTA